MYRQDDFVTLFSKPIDLTCTKRGEQVEQDQSTAGVSKSPRLTCFEVCETEIR
jgi:hypothetical protein